MPHSCPTCGALLDPNTPDGLCPRCLLAKGLDDSSLLNDAPTTDNGPEANATVADLSQTISRTDLTAPLSDQPDTHPHSDPSPPNTVRYFGDYEIQKTLGKGGMGVVYKARQVSLNRPVALKMIKAGTFADEAELRRFQNEAEAVAMLDHPGIVPIHEVGEHDGQRYFSMKLIEGGNLAENLTRYLTNPRAAASLVAEIAEAVHHAHMRGILHRDLKPANILLDPEGHPHITDFGLAKRVESDQEMTQSGAILGTPAYMSPEQAHGHRGTITTATDVYGLGAIFYALLTGRAPFKSDSVVDTIDAVRTRPPEPPRRLNVGTPRDLETICLKCLEKDPRRRYSSAQEFADDLLAWSDSRPIAARRVGGTERVWLWCRRRPAVAALSVLSMVAVLVMLLGAVGYSVQRLTSARGRVDALRSAQIRAVPEILRDLGSDRRLVVDRLQALTGTGQSPDTQLRGLLALVKDDPRHAVELTRRMLLATTTPEELIVIRDAVGPDGVGSVISELLTTGEKGRISNPSDEQLRAFAALAKFDPNQPHWDRDAPGLAAKLTRENPLRLAAWREAFQPVSRHLLAPLLALYADQSKPEDRDRAYVLLSEFATQPGNQNRPEDLAALIPDADPSRLDPILKLLSESDRAHAIAVLTPQLTPLAKFDDLKAQRQGRIGTALLKLKAYEPVWPLFRFADDPSTRTELIHYARDYGVGIHLLLDRLKAETDTSARRALLLAIGSYPIDTLTSTERKALTATWLDWYRKDLDAGIHGAVAWVLDARWNQGAALRKIDQALAGQSPPPGRNWFVNKEGQTYAIIWGPVEFTMGSTKQSDQYRNPDETPHRRKIPRSFAVAAREVRVDEYVRFLAENQDVDDFRSTPQFQQNIPSLDCAMGKVGYYNAARYCNWLSQKDGMPESEWCYPKEPKAGMKLPKDHLDRKGYRLPTEGEWEFFARAGTTSSRSFGRLESRLPDYGWSVGNSQRTMQSTGRLKPNDLGLFDTLGNAEEWCVTPYGAYPEVKSGSGLPAKHAIVDVIVGASLFYQGGSFIMRGGTFTNALPFVRSADRNSGQVTDYAPYFGFRPSRTYP